MINLEVCHDCGASFDRLTMRDTEDGPVCTPCASGRVKAAAVRSASNAGLSWTSLPPLGLFALARTAGEGASKYGLYNYLLGLKQHEVLDHMASHFWSYVAGDRSEPHMAHLTWGGLVCIHNEATRPDLCTMMPGPGFTLTDAIRADLDANRERLAAERAAGKHDDSGRWTLDQIGQCRTIIDQAKSVRSWVSHADAQAAADLEPAEDINRKYSQGLIGNDAARAASGLGPGDPVCDEAAATMRFVYRNHRGMTSTRNVVPFRLYHGTSPWHPGPGWLLDAHDVDKGGPRTFALKDVLRWETPSPLGVDNDK